MDDIEVESDDILRLLAKSGTVRFYLKNVHEPQATEFDRLERGEDIELPISAVSEGQLLPSNETHSKQV